MSDIIFSYLGYKGSSDFSPADCCWYGKILEIRDLVTYEAGDILSLEEEFRKAVDNYIEISRYKENSAFADEGILGSWVGRDDFWYKFIRPFIKFKFWIKKKIADGENNNQRVKYGWCDRDSWAIDEWFINTFSGLLNHYKDKCDSFPPSVDSEEEWYQILDDMLTHLKLARMEWWDEDEQDWIYNPDHEEHKDKFFELFSKYFYDLWW